MNVKTMFLNGVDEEEIYIERIDGFETCNRDTHMGRHKRALYRLKQAPRAWYAHIDNYLQELGIAKSEADPKLYYIIVGGEPLIMVLYMDDLILTRAYKLIQECKSDLASELEMKNMGLMHYFLGLEVWLGDGKIFLGQGKYALKISRRFHMQDRMPMTMPLITNWRKVDTSRSK